MNEAEQKAFDSKRTLLMTGDNGSVIRASEVVGMTDRREVYFNPKWILKVAPTDSGHLRVYLLECEPITIDVDIKNFLPMWVG